MILTSAVCFLPVLALSPLVMSAALLCSTSRVRKKTNREMNRYNYDVRITIYGAAWWHPRASALPLSILKINARYNVIYYSILVCTFCTFDWRKSCFFSFASMHRYRNMMLIMIFLVLSSCAFSFFLFYLSV